jgi:hypothetical protein
VDLGGLAAALDRAADKLGDGGHEIADRFAPDFLDAFKGYTPRLTGALRSSEDVTVSGSGCTVSTHLPLYASFRNDGGDISPKHTFVDKRTGKVREGYLHFNGTFARHVHQEGSHYRERTIAWASGAIGPICEEIVQQILDLSGL